MHFGIIGPRRFIDPITDNLITNPYKKSTYPWLYCEPITGRPHGESPTICTNIVLKWLRQNANKCCFILYFAPAPSIGSNYYKPTVQSDNDFIEPHVNVKELKKHSVKDPSHLDSYDNYISYLLQQFPNIYIIPFEAYSSNEPYKHLFEKFPTRIIDPSIFTNVDLKIAEQITIIKEGLPDLLKAGITLYEKNIVDTIIEKTQSRITIQHQDLLLKALNIKYDPIGPKANIQFFSNKGLVVTHASESYYQQLLRLIFSLRTLGCFHGKLVTILYGDWESSKLKILEQLNCIVHHAGAQPEKNKFMIQRFLDTAKVLEKYPDETYLHLDADIWTQSSIQPILAQCEKLPSFAVWNGHLLIKDNPQYAFKYYQLIEKATIRYQQTPIVMTSPGGIPNGGFHGGPASLFLEYYNQFPKYLEQNLIRWDYSQDELGLFLACNPDRDMFNLNKYWSLVPYKLNMITKLFEDESQMIKPILHFERLQKTNHLIDFCLIHPNHVEQLIQTLGISNLQFTEYF